MLKKLGWMILGAVVAVGIAVGGLVYAQSTVRQGAPAELDARPWYTQQCDTDGDCINIPTQTSGAVSPTSITISTVNSTSATLAQSATFTGTAEDVLAYASVQVFVFVTGTSARGNLLLDWSDESGMTNSFSETWDFDPGSGSAPATSVWAPVRARYLRVRYVNGSSGAQSVFRLTVVYWPRHGPTIYGYASSDRETFEGEGGIVRGWFGLDGSVVISGGIDHGVAEAMAPVGMGGTADTTIPAAVDDADRVRAWFNEYGALVVSGGQAQDEVATAAHGPVRVGTVADTTIPTAVADADVVQFWANEYGALVVSGGEADGEAATAAHGPVRIGGVDGSGNIQQLLTGTDGRLDITAGTGAALLGKAEDVAHASGDTGVAVWGVANEAATARAADGDYVPIGTDLAGRIGVSPGEHVDNGATTANCAAAGTDFGAALTANEVYYICSESENIRLCWERVAATDCDTGAEHNILLPESSCIFARAAATTLSCASTNATGDIYVTLMDL